MDRSLLDRWTDTTVFRLMLFFSGCFVLPVLALGVLTTVISGAFVLVEQPAIGLGQVVFALLSIGGVLGFIGYLRAHGAAKEPSHHSITAIVVCLAAGIGTALVVALLVAAVAVESWFTPSGFGVGLGLAVTFVAANVVWALAGTASMQRLTRRRREHAGHAFDSLPVVLLFVAISLVTAAVLVAVTL